MAPLRTRKSSYSSKVTLYEPPTASTSTASATLSASDTLLPISESPARRTRSRVAAEAGLKGEEEPKQEEEKEGVEEPEVKVTKPRSPRKPKVHVEALAVPHPAPNNWEQTYEVIRKQRERIVAPVDMMGCEQGGKERAKKEEDGEGAEADVKPVIESETDRRLSIIVSLMLSSQTKDPVTHQATMNLRTQLPLGLTLASLESSTAEEIDACISKVGFHTTKANSLKRLAVTLREKHDGEVPGDLPSLLAIHGVGPKMAYLYLQAIGENLGIGVDTHVHRITNRLRWHKKETNTAEQTRLNLESWLPKHLWPKVNKMLVGFGQEICRPVGPRCDLCDVAVAKLCPSRRVVPPTSPRKARVKSEAGSPAKKRTKIEVEEGGEAEGGKPEVEVKLEIEDIKVEVTEGIEAVDAGGPVTAIAVEVKQEEAVIQRE
ncbi:hypothetical protein JCM11641_002226 [Rhodosporidiobolus odoratus]